MFGQKGNTDATLRRKTHEERTAGHLTETYDTGECVNGNPPSHGAINAHFHGFAVSGEIRSLRRNIERIQQGPHGSLSQRTALAR
jgi:hypothetical protein